MERYDMNATQTPRVPVVRRVVEAAREYRARGYNIERDFPGEYYFMFNPKTGRKVRLYYNGLTEEYE